jgi:alanyl-tRNA synthetase
MITTAELKKKYLEFFKNKGHKVISSAPLIPNNDPTVLFTTAGMHPLVPYLLGQEHPLGKRLTSNQICIRTTDIDEVGDKVHFTFFEMLGNWSLGDYFKKEAIEYSYEFLTNKEIGLGLSKNKLAITCFSGTDKILKDIDTYNFWKKTGISEKRIAFIKDNWWGPVGTIGPCGPDTEIHYWASKEEPPETFDPNDNRWVEIWNNVFMEYNKTQEGNLEPLKQKNVDTGLGVERVTAILNDQEDVFYSAKVYDILKFVETLAKTPLSQENQASYKIIVDHLRAATFIIGDNRTIKPSNVDQGYVLRRLIRRAIRHANLIDIKENFVSKVSQKIIELYAEEYPHLQENKNNILKEIEAEENKFKETIIKGLSIFNKVIEYKEKISSKDAFLLYQSYGFPIEIIEELAKEKNKEVDVEGFYKEYEDHKKLSRQGAEKKFKGGLSDSSEKTIQLHTATHLLNQVLREIISSKIKQKGSNITPERLRFDFNFDRKLTFEELKKIEEKVNEVIKKDLIIKKEKMSLKEALETGAQAEFGNRYPEQVWVYTIENFSKEICTGPHVERTSELGTFKILKEQSVAAGIRRIKATLE